MFKLACTTIFFLLVVCEIFSQTSFVIYKDYRSSNETVIGYVGNYQFEFAKAEYFLAYNYTVAISLFGNNANTKMFEKYYITKKMKAHSSYYYQKTKSFYFLGP